MDTFVVYFFPPLMVSAVHCRRQWTAMPTADGNRWQRTAMDGSGRHSMAMDGKAWQWTAIMAGKAGAMHGNGYLQAQKVSMKTL